MTNFSTDAIDTAATISLILSASLEETGDTFDAYRIARRDIEQWVRKNHKKAWLSSGAYRTAVIFPEFVVKFSREDDRQDALVEEATFIQEYRKSSKYRRHFPLTKVVQVGDAPVLLQQVVSMQRPRDFGETLHYAVEDLAERLGITDMHTQNYGWAGRPGKEYPVFIDVDLRYHDMCGTINSAKKIRSWVV